MKQIYSCLLSAVTLAGCASQGTQSAPLVTSTVPAANRMVGATFAENEETRQNPSLWATNPNSLLSMRRAKEIGDLLTVIVEMDDKASLQSSLSRSRNSSDDLNLNALLGLPQWANGVLPGGATVSPAVDIDRTSNTNGSGSVNRAEKVTFRLASRVVGVEPNGNLIIEGYQQTRVSNEVRYLTVSGVIRAQDITRTNTVTYDKIADANLAYVSNGEATDSVKRGAVPKLLDKVLPF